MTSREHEEAVQPHRIARGGAELPRMRDVLGWPGFDVDLVAGAEGLDRAIRLAHATELVDPSAYLRGDELIMTVGTALTGPAECEAFVAAAVRSRAAGIALAIGVAGHEPPAALAPAAERAGLAMFTVPPALPFVAFTEKLQALHDERKRYERHRREDGRMLDYVRRGLASPHVFRDRLPDDPVREYVALCLPETASVELGGVLIEGWIDDVTVVVAEEPFISAFRAGTELGVYGVGGAATASSLGRSVRESIAAFALAARRDVPAGPRDLATLSGLLERLSGDQLAPFADHIIEPLRRFDARHGRALLPTLVAWVRHGGSAAAAAGELGVHTNSVRNRLSRIAKVTGLDPFEFDDRVALTIAVESLRR